MDFYHGQITVTKNTAANGQVPTKPCQDSLGQILLSGIISPYYSGTEGCRLARGPLLMNFTIKTGRENTSQILPINWN